VPTDMSERSDRRVDRVPPERATPVPRTQVDALNQAVYESSDIVAEFQELEGLFPCETYLFEKYVAHRVDVLDLGVGAGRTIPFLEPGARTYVGLDYSTNMVASCRRKYPSLDIRVTDAADLSSLEGSSFDVVVFSYNGLDYLHPVDKRNACIAEIARVLRPGGTVIVSSHNASAIVRPLPAHTNVFRSRCKARAIQVYSSARLAVRTLPSTAFWRGRGYVRDSASANIMYTATPRQMELDFAEHGLVLSEVVGSRFPQTLARLMEPWFYYAFQKR
jgi:SAM-dependent methyltransferase